jgi:siroheme synthase
MLWVVSSAGALVGTARGDSRLLAVAAVSGLASAAVLIRDRLGW